MEIRVRGESKITGRWVYGDLIHYENGDVTILEKPFSAYGYEATQMDRRTQVLPETVGLSTTLHDKHGKEIWEGDKVRREVCSPDDLAYGIYGYTGIVKWERGKFVIECDEDHSFYDHMGDLFSWDELEVIGSIYGEGE